MGIFGLIGGILTFSSVLVTLEIEVGGEQRMFCVTFTTLV